MLSFRLIFLILIFMQSPAFGVDVCRFLKSEMINGVLRLVSEVEINDQTGIYRAQYIGTLIDMDGSTYGHSF